MFVVVLFAAINVIVGCYVTIRLGYGPPDWKTALNLVVPVTTLQDRLNAGRDYLEKKAPWADKLLVRLRVPRPIIIVVPPEEKEENNENSEEGGETNDGTVGEGNEVNSEAVSDQPEPDVSKAEQVPPSEPASVDESR